MVHTTASWTGYRRAYAGRESKHPVFGESVDQDSMHVMADSRDLEYPNPRRLPHHAGADEVYRNPYVTVA